MTSDGVGLTLLRYHALLEPHLAALLQDRGGGDGVSRLLRVYPARGGKLLRPAICLALAESLGVDPGQVARMAASIELLHNALLIHDDIEDASQLRRGEATLHRLLGPALAVHVGDALLARVFSSVFAAAAGSAAAFAAAAELQRGALRTVEGQTLDLLARERDPAAVSREEYHEIVLKKTCAYTTLLPMRVAAAYAGLTDPRTVRTLSRFALFCGVAFQIQDDLRSFGSTAINGKSPAEDLLEGKITLPLIRFFEVADQGARTRAREFFTCPRPERRASEAAWLSRSIVEAGCLHHAREIGYVAAARATHEWDALAPELLPGAGAEFLAALPRMMVTHS